MRKQTICIGFDFAVQIEQSLFFLNPKFQASSLLLLLYRPVCVRPGGNPKDIYALDWDTP